MIIWTPTVLSVLYTCVLHFCICTCSVQLSMSHMERCSRNTLIIIIIIIIVMCLFVCVTEWSRETLLEAWMDDPVACCHKCGVTPPGSLFSEKPQVQESLASPLPSPSHASSPSMEAECNICLCTFLLAEEPVHMSCMHQFCRHCWERSAPANGVGIRA